MEGKFHKSFDICFKFLKVCGLWIDGKESKKYRFYGISLVILSPFVFLSLFILGIYQNGVTVEMAGALAFIIATTVEIVRIFHLIFNLKKIELFYESMMKSMKFVKNDKYIKKRLDLSLKMFIVLVGNAFVAATAGFITTFSSKVKPFPYGDVFDVNDLSFWAISFKFYSTIIVFYVAPIFVTLGFLPIFFMNFIIGLMEDFNEKLENIDKNDNTSEELKEIIETHVKIQYLVKELVRNFRVSFFAIGIAGSLVLCLNIFIMPLVILIN